MSGRSPQEDTTVGYWRRVGLIGGPVAALAIVLLVEFDPAHPAMARTAAVAALMAVWWMTEALPIPATALVPMALFPLLGVSSGRAVAGQYFNDVVFLFIGGFIMALAMEKWGLFRRFALAIMLVAGASPSRLVLGFMAATAFVSMWVSNTAAAMMMVPIALAVITQLKDSTPPERTGRLSTSLLLGIAYGATIGGIATLIGTPPNLAFSRLFAIAFPRAPEITFARWMLFGVPFAIVLLALTWILLVLVFRTRSGAGAVDASLLRQEYRQLGRMRFEERVVLWLFLLLAFLWVFRQDITLGSWTIPGWAGLFGSPSFLDDGVVAIVLSLLLFIIPARNAPGERLMDWETATRLNWGIVILFGGGFALAAAMEESGLSAWVAQHLQSWQGIPPLLLVAAICVSVTFLTELVSNTACVQIVLPILAPMAVAIGVNPLLLMVPATVAASCGFMLPVGTPPNAIVFGTGEIKMRDMLRVGIVLDLLSVLLVTIFMYLIGLPAFGIGSVGAPPWATGS
ncbi:MAG: SLC13 family permease [Candidatus Zixiibacteriota bacterium]